VGHALHRHWSSKLTPNATAFYDFSTPLLCFLPRFHPNAAVNRPVYHACGATGRCKGYPRPVCPEPRPPHYRGTWARVTLDIIVGRASLWTTSRTNPPHRRVSLA
jgi:hypothetical protein